MICRNCGRSIANEEANFCENCGFSFRENDIVETLVKQGRNESGFDSIESNKLNKETDVSFGNWMKSLLLPFIPFVGIFIYFIMLFVWSFGANINKTKKSWARAQLIVTIMILFVFIYLMTSTFPSGTSLSEIQNLYQNLYN